LRPRRGRSHRGAGRERLGDNARQPPTRSPMSDTEAMGDLRDSGTPETVDQTDPTGPTSPTPPPAGEPEPAGTLHRFIETADAIRASGSKIEKTRLLAGFCRSLSA